MIFDDILEQQNLMTKKNLNTGVKKPTLQDIYAKFQAENQKPTSWLDQIAQNLPALAKIGSAAFIKNPWQQGAVQESLSGEQQRQDAMRQAYQQSQEQKQKDFMDIAYKQAGIDTEAEKSEQSSKQFETQIGLQEKTLQQKMQEEALKKLQEETKAKQAQENWQKEYDLKQAELNRKSQSGENLTPEDKKYMEARGTSKANAQTAYEESMANFEPLEKQLMEAIELVPNTVTGPLAGLEVTSRRYGLGSKDKLANTARLQTIINKQVLAGLQNFKGAISDKEREFLEKMVGGGTGATAKEIQSRLNTVLENLRNDVKSKQKAFERFNGGKTKKDSLGIL